MALLTLRDYAAEKLAPAWARGELGDKLVRLFALQFDLLAQGALLACKSVLPSSSNCADDAADLIGAERMLPRYVGETLPQYKARLIDAWDSWQVAGTQQAIINQLAIAGFTAEVYENFQWDWDGTGTYYWCRFWVVLTGHPFTSNGLKTDGTWLLDGTKRAGGDFDADQLSLVYSIVERWRDPIAEFQGLIIVTNAGAWAATPSGQWRTWENRSTAALYIDEDVRAWRTT